jgi:hypothetical protein
MFAQHQDAITIRNDISLGSAIHMQVTLNLGLGANQGIDLRYVTLFAVTQHCHPSASRPGLNRAS